MSSAYNPQETKITLKTASGRVTIFSLKKTEKLGLDQIGRLPYSIRILLENALRNCDGYQVTVEDIRRLANWSPRSGASGEIAFKPGRVILQDFTGVPCVVDLAAMRSAIKRMGGDYKKVNPKVACDLVIDHSLQVDAFGSKEAFAINLKKEFERNQERYEFLKWGQNTFKNFRVIPPATGIIHQINLEYLAKGVLSKKVGKETIIYPDTLVGTDSHTTMINGLGIVGWGVGGIEAEAVMLGEPIYMLLPEVIGVKLRGTLKENVNATDLVLTVTQLLRKKGVVGKFVEFFGDGLDALTLADRATVANMAPEYGATMGIFPVDQETLNYYKITGRSLKEIDLIERYFKEQGLFRRSGDPDAEFSDVLKIDLNTIEPSLAGPKRPHDWVPLSTAKDEFKKSFTAPVAERGFSIKENNLYKTTTVSGSNEKISHGSVVLAAITSCANTSNPSVLIGAGLLARNAVKKGLNVKSYVKTSFAPGSRVVTDYLKDAGLLTYFDKLGFNIVGYGCTTCIGNSGPLPENVAKAIKENNLIACGVLSGNRNFEGRINPLVQANYLASPALVIAYALAGSMNIDFEYEPLGKDRKENNIFLRDIWPAQKEIDAIIAKSVCAKAFKSRYKNVLKGDSNWQAIKTKKGDIFDWKEESTYIQEPPFFVNLKNASQPVAGISGARVLAVLGDSVTTDHISPAGAISPASSAGIYLQKKGVLPKDFNSYGSRRGNDKVMTRGTFANTRLRNFLAPEKEGPWTVYFPENKLMTIFEACELYKKNNIPLVVLAGKEYGTGSSRDWAAKGAALLGVRVVLTESFERIHRSNLVGMGVLPLEFIPGESRLSLGLKGDEIFDFKNLNNAIKPRQEIAVTAKSSDGSTKEFKAIARIDTPVEADYYRNGGILPTILRKLI
ncbi:MAG TPA: aconitate hydratase AcnA [Candidatus Omnitrophota bacterium]|nr:aconitate hydratase AcnA [Candidatus Omnitrophota bacterium]HPD85430.1 aconitate hydratase AcnA [Candidatus Omnitrophota bacterium]HRZ04069.1 aconitate hydratase AcnA [Candidatus Omnitrophota bacterium]